MPDRVDVDPNQWVNQLFEKILDFIKELELTQPSPSLFLVYAHNNPKITDCEADAEVAEQLIKWLYYLGVTIYSDRTPGGNNAPCITNRYDTDRIHDILHSQLCLLPQPSSIACKRVDHVILCGSDLLRHYLESNYYQDSYYPRLHEAYERMQDESDPSRATAILSTYVNSQVNEEGFHHILTELAFLAWRISNEKKNHGIIPFLLNGNPQTNFPRFISDSTMIRIEEGQYRKPSEWKGRVTYQDQGLHVAFFKLLKRLWPLKESVITLIEEEVYQHCLQLLQNGGVTVNQIELALNKVPKRTTQAGIANWRAESINLVVEKIKEIAKETQKQLVVDTNNCEQQLEDWYSKQLISRLTIQRISGDRLPMESCYINLAVVEYQPKAASEDKEPSKKGAFHRLASAEQIAHANLNEPIPLEELFASRQLKNGTQGIPKRILIRGRAGIGKTTLAKKSVYEHSQHGLWNDQFEQVLWIPLRHLKGKPANYHLRTFFYDEYFSALPEGHELAKTLYEKIQASPTKTLLLLDGWDEIAQEASTDCLTSMLNHPSILITSRPGAVPVHQIRFIDLELETFGFSDDNVMAYLDNPAIVIPQAGREAIKTFIQTHPFVKTLVNIPIQLDALCYSWDEIQQAETPIQTMTELYEAMTHKLWRKDIIRLAKEEGGQRLTEERVKNRRFRYLEPFIKAESNCLERLALQGMIANRIEFTPRTLDTIIQARWKRRVRHCQHWKRI